MLRELQGANTVQDRPADIAIPATSRGNHSRRCAAQGWYRVAAVLIAAGFVAVVGWQMRAVDMTDAAVVPAPASIEVDRAD